MDFETLHKDQLYKGKVYPVTPAILREKLAAVPQRDEVVVRYSTYSMSERRMAKVWKGIGKKRGPNYIIQAHYSCRDISIPKGKPRESEDQEPEVENSVERFLKPRMWSMSVDAISAEQLALVRKSLENEGYARFVTWFIERRKLAGTFGYHGFGMALQDGVIEYIERGS